MTTRRTPSLPMAPDHAYVWRRLEPALASRGLLDGSVELGSGDHVERRDVAKTLALAVAMERRIGVKITDLTSSRDRRSAERIRARFRRHARVFAFMLGLIPVERVEAKPVDIRDHDPEIAEWFGCDPELLAAAARQALALPKIDNKEAKL